MNKHHFIALAIMTAISGSAVANENTIYNSRSIVDASTETVKASTKSPLQNQAVVRTDTHYDAPELDISSKVSVGYVIADGLKEHGEDAEDGIGIEVELYVDDYRFKGQFESVGLVVGDTTKDVETMGLEVAYSFYRNNNANFHTGAGWERVDIAGDVSGFTDGNTPFSESGYSSDTAYALLGVEYAITPKLSAELSARWDFSHDNVSLTLNGEEAKLYEDIGFSAAINYALTDRIGVGFYHERASELMSNSRIEMQYKF